jgi:hypothetical protein
MTRRWRTAGLGMMAASATALLVGLAPVTVVSAQTRGPSVAVPAAELLSGTVPAAAEKAANLGAVSPHTALTLVAPLTLSKQAELNAFVQGEYTKGSSNYHEFLTPSTFAAEFGASEAQIKAATQYLTSQGLSVAPVAANHLYLEFSGSVGRIDGTFHTSIDRFKAATGDTTFTANDTNITLPQGLGDLVSGVVGMNSLAVPHSMIEPPTKSALALDNARAATTPPAPEQGVDGGTTPCAADIAGAGYTAPQLAEAYNFNGLYGDGYLGQGMTASLAEYDDFHSSNVATVQSCFGDTATTVNRVLVDGGSGGPPGAGEAEDMADITTMLEMLPKLSKLDVYVGPVTNTAEFDLWNEFVTRDDSPVLSSSWGNCEEDDSQSYAGLLNSIAEEAAAQGQQIFEAAGDSGAVDCRGTPFPTGDSISVMTEAASPFVTGVGGTDLGYKSTTGLGHDEDTWNDAGAGGGGQSTYWTMPSWQAALPSAVAAPGASGASCGAPAGTLCREIPDLSADADPDLGMQTDTQFQFKDDVGSPGYSMYCGTPNCTLTSLVGVPGLPATPPTLPEGSGGWYPIGGTSLATPTTASAALLWDEEAEAKGIPGGLGFLNPALYGVAANPSDYANDFFDITTDSNDAQYDSTDCPSGCNTSQLYKAATGYDMASGLGSYNAANLGSDLVAQATQISLTPDVATVYGYTKGMSTTSPVVVSSGFDGSPYSVTSSASWLHATGGTIGHTLEWSADPVGLTAGTYNGTISITGHGSTATLTVDYAVTPPAKISVSPSTLSFSEAAVTTSGDATPPTCGSTLWEDQLTAGLGGTAPTAAQLAPSLQTLDIENDGAAGSMLHWTAFFVSETSDWLNNNIDPPGTTVQQQPTQPIVSSEGSDARGATSSVALASWANVNRYGGYDSDMNQGTYHGTVVIRDLADPKRVLKVPAILVLGSGADTPTVVATPSSLSATVVEGTTTSVNLALTDGSKDCGYAYSVGTNAPWASIDPDLYSGEVSGSSATTIPIALNASDLRPGTYHNFVVVGSQNAEPNPVKVPITFTVTASP